MTFSGISQKTKTGPYIENYGAVWEIDNPDFKTDTSQEFKVVFDVKDGPTDDNELNRNLNTVARFLNMHGQSGIPLAQLKVALIVHGTAARNLLTDEGHQKRYKTNNPNRELVEELLKAGVEVIMCGQSSKTRGLPKEELIPGVKIALSAMTANIQFQNQGYRPIKL
ncbi:DsrE family protein [Flagellimonas zhangzhouensis]|uniref:Intracellular sulfur oxidation protein, DsrE/DsrF family n=1 Tax=Flagellimonas zhangzhouensis TaxID=1073328 RepID=A0A1H2SAY2_9FLAO|nr:DsrE family protein [Allomuricauda zhangzhouensis]SDQ72809.1 Intracellular sulfur oxidation protein, DsrE/DsrF family [Allomuricauda zhangzhouensis]SDW28772.1 Intracellular sulfur oxidation protein, DsrE/DsrF family [Allomuricauda zhangzhouensis]